MKIDFSQVVTAEQKQAEAQVSLVARMRSAVDRHVDATAQARGYNSAAHCATYVNSTVPAWAKEAQTFVAWRDAVWVTVFQMLAMVQAGKIPPPSLPNEIITELPEIEWPDAKT
jgi:hypothetical protein